MPNYKPKYNRNSIEAERERARHSRSFQQVAESIHDDFYGNYANRMTTIDAIVNHSQEGSCSDEQGQHMVDDLFSQRYAMPAAQYRAAVEALGCYLQNNLSNGVANDIYHNFVCDDRTYTP